MATWRLWTPNDAARLKTVGAGDCTEQLRKLPITEYEHIKGGKLPRNHKPRAYRLSAGARVLAAVAVEYRRSRGTLEVRELLYPANADETLLRELLLFILTDAYRCSGSCRLLFPQLHDSDARKRLDGLRQLAEAQGVILANWASGAIQAAEGRRLFLALSGLAPAAREVVEKLEENGRTRAETVCFLIHNGVWSAQEMESLLLTCSYPDLILWGGASPADRLLAQVGLESARAALLLGRLDRCLRSRWEEQDDIARSLVDHPRPLAIRCEVSAAARRYRLGEDPPSVRDWCRGRCPIELTAGEEILAIGLSRPQRELQLHWEDDMRAAAEVVLHLTPAQETFLVVPAEFDQLAPSTIQNHLDLAERAGLTVLVMPDTFAQLSLEARRRLSLSRIIRR